MEIENEVLKTMISLSDTEEEADGVIEEFTPHRTVVDKLKFLLGLFPTISIIARCDGKKGDKDQTDYRAVLSAVINLKWR